MLELPAGKIEKNEDPQITAERELREETEREGMDGISPRYIINRLSGALVRDGATCINPIDALRAIKNGFDQHTGISAEQRERRAAISSLPSRSQ